MLAPHVLVGVEHVDIARARFVGLASDRAHERCVLDQRVDAERLPRLEVEAHLDDELRVRLESLVGGGHGGQA